LRPKTSRLLFGQLVWRKIIFFQFFLLNEWTKYFTSFLWTTSTPNSDSVWARGKFLLKTSIKSFFMYFLKSSYMQPCGWNCPRAEGQGFQKIFCFAHKILVFHFFFTFFLLLTVLYEDTFNVTTMIWMWSFWIFSRIFTRSIVLKFGVKTTVNKKNSNSFIFTNLEMKFEACMLYFIWKWGAKDP
jgi:hypothetical protein